eukprot:1277763-Prymnesium_polylepis.1
MNSNSCLMSQGPTPRRLRGNDIAHQVAVRPLREVPPVNFTTMAGQHAMRFIGTFTRPICGINGE